MRKTVSFTWSISPTIPRTSNGTVQARHHAVLLEPRRPLLLEVEADTQAVRVELLPVDTKHASNLHNVRYGGGSVGFSKVFGHAVPDHLAPGKLRPFPYDSFAAGGEAGGSGEVLLGCLENGDNEGQHGDDQGDNGDDELGVVIAAA
ncbi:hypothetical protein HG530_001349 [Fusarium avenaceum]|nr:hypothetical protein HG530_001349 [Fusarium avenaceum]